MGQHKTYLIASLLKCYRMKSFNIYSKPKVDKLDAFQFSWQSNKDVQEAAIMQVLTSDDLNDPRLGAQIGSPCATCGLDYEKCCGHWGYYEFLFPLFLGIL